MDLSPDSSAFSLPSKVGFDTLVETRAAGEDYLDGCPDPVFDLGTLTESNSAVVAVLIAWVRHAHLQGKSIVLVHVPAELRNIIDACEVTDVLPLQDP